jgi:hypothetical protein
VEFWRPYFLCLLAEAYMETGRLDDGLGALTEVLAAAGEHGNRVLVAEMHRLKGELLLRQMISTPPKLRAAFSARLRLREIKVRNRGNCAPR